MGLFDQMAGTVIGKVLGEHAALAQVAMALFQQYDGLPGILQLLKDHGLAAEVDSWVSQRANMPVNVSQIVAALGEPMLAKLALKLEMTPADLSQKIAEMLPDVVNQLTPNGVVENNPALMLSRLMAMIKQA